MKRSRSIYIVPLFIFVSCFKSYQHQNVDIYIVEGELIFSVNLPRSEVLDNLTVFDQMGRIVAFSGPKVAGGDKVVLESNDQYRIVLETNVVYEYVFKLSHGPDVGHFIFADSKSPNEKFDVNSIPASVTVFKCNEAGEIRK